MMDSRAIFFAVVILSIVKLPTHLAANVTTTATTDSKTTQAVVKLMTSEAPTTSNNLPGNPNSSTIGQVTKSTVSTPTTPTTPAPLNCKVGSCSGSDECLNDTKTVKSTTCKSREICELDLKDINGTISEYKFSCATSCSAQKGKVACCSTSNCILDLNNGGDFVSRYNFVAMVSLIFASLLIL
ncbi:mucin-5AC-like [Mercenaria mercenaria]|uniref:mucin-5AC-like n=1 Tax=Mercenaria mercenaria TaxID=6596 RepID=UPI00234EFBC8|nr:mucin-5AC-like [Mercenaria mercenaria]